MLNFIRSKKQSIIIKSIFAIIVLSFVGTMYAVWGEGTSGRGALDYAAMVNGSKISPEEFQNAYNRISAMYQNLSGQPMSPEMEKQLGLKKMALDNLINNRLILKEAGKMGITVSDDELASAIQSMPDFQKDGVFSRDLYYAVFKNLGIPPSDFEEQQKQEMILNKTVQTLRNKVTVSDAEALEFFKKENDKISLEYASFAPEDFVAAIKPTEKDLSEYLQKNQDEFRTDEKVAVSYIALDPATLLHSLSLTEDEIQTFYQKNIDRWQEKGDIRPLSEVREQVKAEVLKRKALELATDTLYKNINSNDFNLIAQELKLKTHEIPLFPLKTPPQALADKAELLQKISELKQGEMGGPVETPSGIYIVKIAQRIPSSVPPLADIRVVVEQKTKTALSAELAKKKAEEAASLFAAGKPVAFQTTNAFGYSEKGDIPSIGASSQLMEAAFKLTTTTPTLKDPYKVGNRWYAVRLKTRMEAPRTEFEKAKANLKQRILPQKQEEFLASWLKELRSKATIKINPSLIADETGD